MSPINYEQKPHAVCVPYPAQGHVNPTMQLAKLLHSRGFHITFVNNEFNHRRLIRSVGPEFAKGLPGFSFEAIPDGLPPSEKDATQDIPALCASVKVNCRQPLKELLLRLKWAREVPPVTCVVSDATMSCFAVEAAEDLGIPHVQLWTASACSFLGYLQYEELVKRGIVPFKDGNFMHDGTLDKPVEWDIPGMKNIRFKDLPSFMRTQSTDDIMFNHLFLAAQNCSKSPTIIFNSFRDFEGDALREISAKHPASRIYAIGPLGLLGPQIVPSESPVHSLRSTLWKEDSKCLEWLHGKAPGSVVYVNYGSITTMTPQNFVEFAWGLAESGQAFLWIVRSDVVAGSDAAEAFPEGFWEAVEGRGVVATWCPQERVLGHPAVGAFLTHCGWNSTLDAVCAGVPVMGWPFFADQQTNCRYACVNWGMGAEVGEEVERGEVAGLVREMMEGEKGKVWKEKALEWKRTAVEATDVGGSSRVDFDKLIEEGFNFQGHK